MTDLLFADFWKIYPRKCAKRAAEKAYFAALKRGVTHSQLTTAAMKYATDRAGKDPAFTAHPATWLNADRCFDEPAIPMNAEPRGRHLRTFRASDYPDPAPFKPRTIGEILASAKLGRQS